MNTIGPYQIIDRVVLSEGEEWFVGKDSLNGQEVFLRTIDIVDAKLAEKFYQEAVVCGVLNHPGVFTLYRLGEQQGAAFVATERFVGMDLRQIIAQRRPLTLEKKLEIMIGVAEALVYAHSVGILHRNLRPSNIFFDAASGRTRVAGFGLARVQGTMLTTTGHSTQVPSYLAPEQLSGTPAEQSDVFSAAAIFYELVTGTHPFQGVEGAGALSRPPAPSPMAAYAASIPPGLESAIMKGIMADHRVRHPAASALLSALRQAQMNLERERQALHSTVVAMRDEMVEKVNEIWSFLKKPWAQTMLKAGNVDLDETYPRINAELESGANLHYFKLTQLQQELRDVLALVSKISARIVVVDPVEPPAQPPAVEPFERTVLEVKPAVLSGGSAATATGPIWSGEKDNASVCPQCGAPKPLSGAHCAACARGRKRSVLTAVSAFIILGVVAILFVVWPWTADSLPADREPVWGIASIAKETMPSATPGGRPEGASLPVGTKVQLVDNLPERAKWSLDLPVKVRLEAGQAGWIPLRALTRLSARDHPDFVLWHARENCAAGDLACLEDVERQYTGLGHADNGTASFLAERFADETLRGAAAAPCNVMMLRKTSELLFSLVEVAELQDKVVHVKTSLAECSKRGLPTPELALWAAFSACVASDEPECAERVERTYVLLGKDEEIVQVYLADAHARNAAKMPAQCFMERPKAEMFLTKLGGKSAFPEKVARIRQRIDAGCTAVPREETRQVVPEDPNKCSSFEECRDKAGVALAADDCTAARVWMARAQDYSGRTAIVFDDIDEKCKP